MLHAYVLPEIVMGTSTGNPAWVEVERFGPGWREYGCDFGDGKTVKVKVLRHGL